jgi:hypothetical protein
MTQEQTEVEQAIANIDKVVSAFSCDRQTRNVIETGWRLIINRLRESQPEIPAKDDAAT